MSIYPSAIDGFEQLPLVVDGVTKVNAFSVNNLREAILKIEEELGVMPSGAYDTVADRLDTIEITTGSFESRVATLEAQVAALEAELGSNPSGSFPTVEDRLDFLEAATTAPLSLTTDAALITGALLRLNTSGNVELADANTGTIDDARVIGSSASSYLIGETAEINSITGKLIPVRFAAAPAAGSNSSPVYLSNIPGVATLTAPTASNSVIFVIGILQGANGVDNTPNVVFQPNLVAFNP